MEESEALPLWMEQKWGRPKISCDCRRWWSWVGREHQGESAQSRRSLWLFWRFDDVVSNFSKMRLDTPQTCGESDILSVA